MPRNPDRIDFSITSRGTLVSKFFRQDGRDVPLDLPDLHVDFDLDQALTWCENHGYTVRRWPTGARAFKGTAWPIRTRAQIQKRRAEIENLAQHGHLPDGFFWGGLDFALDL